MSNPRSNPGRSTANEDGEIRHPEIYYPPGRKLVSVKQDIPVRTLGLSAVRRHLPGAPARHQREAGPQGHRDRASGNANAATASD